MAASTASDDALALIKLIHDDMKTVIAPVPLLCDNHTATKVLANPVVCQGEVYCDAFPRC